MTLNFNEAVALGLPELYRRRDELAGQEDFDRGLYNVITNAISHLEAEQQAKAEQEKREQKQAEQLDGLLKVISELPLFESIAPEPENGERLHEYEERRKEFNLILYDFVREQMQAVIQSHNAEIAEKDNRIRALNDQSLRDRQELDEAKQTIARLEEENKQLAAQFVEKDEIIEGQKRTIAQKDQEISRLLERIRELEQAQKPTEYAKPSESLVERVNNLRAKSSSLNKTVEDRLKAFYERNKHVLQVPDFMKKEEQPSGESFRGEDSDGGQSTDGVDASGTKASDATVSGGPVTFPTFPASAGVSEEAEGNDRGMGFEAWARAEIEALKKRVDHLYRVSGHSEPAA